MRYVTLALVGVTLIGWARWGEPGLIVGGVGFLVAALGGALVDSFKRGEWKPDTPAAKPEVEVPAGSWRNDPKANLHLDQEPEGPPTS